MKKSFLIIFVALISCTTEPGNGGGNENENVDLTKGTWADVGVATPHGPDTTWLHSVMSTDGTLYNSYITSKVGDPNHMKGTVKKFNGTDWEIVGTEHFTEAVLHNMSLALVENVPYVVFTATATSTTTPNKVVVMKFDGTTWVAVGSAINTYPAYSTIIGAYKDNVYVLYSEAPDANAVAVKTSLNVRLLKLEGDTWTQVGEDVGKTGIAPSGAYGPVWMTALDFDTEGNPYVAFQDGSNVDKKSLTVKKFSGVWTVVGEASFGGGSSMTTDAAWVGNIALAVHGSTPYVAFQDNSSLGHLSVMKFDGTKWNYVGEKEFTGGGVKYLSLDTDSKGNPYVIYLANFWPAGVAIQVFQDNVTKDDSTEDNVTGWNFVGEEKSLMKSYHAYTTVLLSSDDVLYVSFIAIAAGKNTGYIKKFTLN